MRNRTWWSMWVRVGTIRHPGRRDIFVCRHFVDRDMQKLVERKDGARLIQWICCPKRILFYTGRAGGCGAIRGYSAELSDVSGDVVEDMEAYTQALYACQECSFHFGEVRDGYYRAELRETLGRQACRCSGRGWENSSKNWEEFD